MSKFPDAEISALLQKIEKLEKENALLWQENRRAQVSMFQSKLYKISKKIRKIKFLKFNFA